MQEAQNTPLEEQKLLLEIDKPPINYRDDRSLGMSWHKNEGCR